MNKQKKKTEQQPRSQKEQLLFFFGIVMFVILITIKIWIKMTFELRMIGLVLLIAASWTFKYLLFKHLKSKIKQEKQEQQDHTPDRKESNAEQPAGEDPLQGEDLPKT